MYIQVLSFVSLSLTRITNSTARGHQGAWQRFERGELALFSFYEAFGRDLSDTVNGNLWYKDYCKKKGLSEYFLLYFVHCLGSF